MSAAVALTGCNDQPVARVYVPGPNEEAAYQPQAMAKPLPPEGYIPGGPPPMPQPYPGQPVPLAGEDPHSRGDQLGKPLVRVTFACHIQDCICVSESITHIAGQSWPCRGSSMQASGYLGPRDR